MPKNLVLISSLRQHLPSSTVWKTS